ncbi:MAG: hypothetical protein V4561_05360 [Bacteroidota bacterium]
MNKAIKIITISLASIILLAAVSYFGLRQFTRSIYKQRTCEWANIDNIEMHAEVDVPKIKTFDCIYKKELNTKMAMFEIDKANVDMDRYIKLNNFRKLNSVNEISFDNILKKETNVDSLMASPDLYYTKGSYKGETWQTILDNSSGRLWVTIQYND